VVGLRGLDRPGHRYVRPLSPHRPTEDRGVTAVEIISLALAVGLGVYLLVALLRPDKFQ